MFFDRPYPPLVPSLYQWKTPDIEQGENSGKLPSNGVTHANDVNNSSSSSLMVDEIQDTEFIATIKETFLCNTGGRHFKIGFLSTGATRLIDEYGNMRY